MQHLISSAPFELMSIVFLHLEHIYSIVEDVNMYLSKLIILHKEQVSSNHCRETV